MSLLIPSILKQAAEEGGGGGSIAYESIGAVFTETSLEQTTGSISVDMPSGLTNGDLLVAIIVYRVIVDPTLPAGWTERTSSSADNVGWGFGVSIFTHPVTDAGSEPGSITVSGLDTNREVTAVIIRLSNGTSFDAISESIGTDTDHDTPDVTPTASSGLILQVAGLRSSGAYTITPPATNIVNQDSDAGLYMGLGVSYVASSGTSAQGGATFTTSVSKQDALATLAFH